MIEEKKCTHAHCRCMNLKGECPNFHYADCNAEFIAQERAKGKMKAQSLKHIIHIPIKPTPGDEVHLTDDITLQFREDGDIGIYSSQEIEPTETFKSIGNYVIYL